MGVSLPAISAGVGIAGSLGGLFGGSPASNVNMPPPPPQYNPQDIMGQMAMPYGTYSPYMGGAAGGAYAGLQGIPGQQLGQQYLPYAQQTGMNMYNNPFAQDARAGSQMAAGLGQQAAGSAWDVGRNLIGNGTSMIPYGQQYMQQGQNLLPWAGQLLNMGFDPQGDLYNRTQHQITEQQRAGQSARGIARTPYGAGLENDAMRNFNIDWQNQQLGRANTAAAGASQLFGQYGASQTGGAGIMGQGAGMALQGQQLVSGAPGQYMQASMLPYATYQQQGGDQMGALNSIMGYGTGAQSLAQNPLAAYYQFLGLGNQGAGLQNTGVAGAYTAANQSGTLGVQAGQLGLNQANLDFNQQQTLGKNLGAGLQAAGKADWSWLKAT